MGVAAWLTAIVTVLCAWAVSLVLIAGAAVEGLSDSSAVTLCLELFGVTDHTPLPGRLGALALIFGALLVSAVLVDRVRRRIRILRSRSHEHAHAARLLGRPTDSSDVVVVDAQQLLAYCVVGRPMPSSSPVPRCGHWMGISWRLCSLTSVLISVDVITTF